MLTAVTDATFADVVLANRKPVAVDFWAQWCPSCPRMTRALEGLAADVGDDLVVVTLDVDENPAAARAYRVLSLPTVLLFRAGEVTATVVGAKPPSALRRLLLGEPEPYANR